MSRLALLHHQALLTSNTEIKIIEYCKRVERLQGAQHSLAEVQLKASMKLLLDAMKDMLACNDKFSRHCV